MVPALGAFKETDCSLHSILLCITYIPVLLCFSSNKPPMKSIPIWIQSCLTHSTRILFGIGPTTFLRDFKVIRKSVNAGGSKPFTVSIYGGSLYPEKDFYWLVILLMIECQMILLKTNLTSHCSKQFVTIFYSSCTNVVLYIETDKGQQPYWITIDYPILNTRIFKGSIHRQSR